MDKPSSLAKIQEKNDEQGRTLTFVNPIGDSLRNLEIAARSNKIAFDKSGEIVYRASVGRGSSKDWESLFSELTQ